MPQTPEQLHQQYVEFIKNFRRMKKEKYNKEHGEQLCFDFMDEAYAELTFKELEIATRDSILEGY